jgi:hypothetical protein
MGKVFQTMYWHLYMAEVVVIKSESSVFRSTKKPIGYKVAPRRKADLRTVSNGLRLLPQIKACYKDGGHFIDTLHLLEDVLFHAGFHLHLVEDNEFPETVAFTVPQSGLIVLRNGIYEDLFRNDPFARYTVVHEFSHIVLGHAVTLHRGAALGEHQWYEDSEWQANNLTAELMMPVDIVQKLDCKPILIMAECGVSAQAVQYRLSNLMKEGVI